MSALLGQSDQGVRKANEPFKGEKQNPRLHLLEMIGDVAVYAVDADIVERDWFMDFTQASNDVEAPEWMPPNEIWIDGALLAKKDRYLLHEIVERNLMMALGWDYETKGHPHANAVEHEALTHPEKLPELLARAKADLLALQPPIVAAGIKLRTPDGKTLFVKRSGHDHEGEWAFPGGGREAGETPEQTARRELFEETGISYAGHLSPLAHNPAGPSGAFLTFGADIPEAVSPKLNHEHSEHLWIDENSPPQPLHPGVAAMYLKSAKDMTPEDWRGMAKGLAKFLKEEMEEPEHAEDQEKPSKAEAGYEPKAKDMSHTCAGCTHFTAPDGCNKIVGPVNAEGWCKYWEAKAAADNFMATPPNSAIPMAKRSEDQIAMDRASVRSYDVDGRLHVSCTPISKANVCPYWGREIPRAELLGLDPNRQYLMFRDPEELAKAATTFNGIQLMQKHVAVNAADAQQWDVVGTTGTDAEFDGTYLRNSLVVWVRSAIDGIENETQKELSCSYHYDPDMTPGFFKGQRYDGVMRNLKGNHVALVKAGRAGPDVIVGDAAMSWDLSQFQPTYHHKAFKNFK